MSYLEQKMEEAEKSQDTGTATMAKLGSHLAFKGFIVTEKDAMGPVEVMLHSGGHMETWRRESRDKKDFWMRLVRSEILQYEWP